MKILLIKRGAIGDVLMTTPLIRQLRMANLNVQIDYCIASSSAVALKGNSYIDNLIILNDSVFSIKGVMSFIIFMLKIRKKYDYIFILGKHWLVNLLCNISGAFLIGFLRNKWGSCLLNQYVKYCTVERYQVLYYLDLLKKSNICPVDYSDINMDLVISDDDKFYIDNKLNAMSVSNFVVITNSGGNNQFEQSGIRMLPHELMLELLEQQLSRVGTVVLLGGDVDKITYNWYVNVLSHKIEVINLINLAGELSLSQSCYLLSKANRFFVTDCGAMHIGLIAGIATKMVCIFGPTNPKHILPPNFAGKVIWQDEDIYSTDYQIYGKMSNNSRYYFRRLKVNEII